MDFHLKKRICNPHIWLHTYYELVDHKQQYIVAYLHHARIAEPQKSVNTAINSKRL
jgi:hypothetical protein